MRIRPSARGTGLSVGIDLGTTYSAVARVDGQGMPRILRNRDGERLCPSVVLFDGEHPIVGTMAKRAAVAAPLDVVQLVKRSMGDPSWRFETAGGTAYRPEEISALILKRLKADAEAELGAEVTDAVITVPAYFDDAPRRATIDAGTIAGLNVRRVINEPTAAALAYGLRADHDGTVLVYDLGGGTFDVTVLRIVEGEFHVLATFGDRNLGGFDFDNLLMRLLNERFVAAGGPDLLDDDRTEAALRERSELAKHTLTGAPHAQVGLSADGFSRTIAVTRAEFEDLASGLLSRTRDIATMVVEEAGLTWTGVDRILPAGGSTRMPMVHAMLKKVSGTTPDLSSNPDDLVASGAALQAHLLDPEGAPSEFSPPSRIRPQIRDVTSQGLGELLISGSDGPVFNQVIIPRNSAIPASGSVTATTRRPGQRTLRTRITQGDDRDPAYVRVVGEQRFPIPEYNQVAPFRTTLSYDEDQTIYVEITDLATDRTIGTFDIANIANMTREQVARATGRIQRIDVG